MAKCAVCGENISFLSSKKIYYPDGRIVCSKECDSKAEKPFLEEKGEWPLNVNIQAPSFAVVFETVLKIMVALFLISIVFWIFFYSFIASLL